MGERPPGDAVQADQGFEAGFALDAETGAVRGLDGGEGEGAEEEGLEGVAGLVGGGGGGGRGGRGGRGGGLGGGLGEGAELGAEVGEAGAGVVLEAADLLVCVGGDGAGGLEVGEAGLEGGQGLLPVGHHAHEGVRGLGSREDRVAEAGQLGAELVGLGGEGGALGAAGGGAVGDDAADLAEGGGQELLGEEVPLDPGEDCGVDGGDRAA